MPVHAQQSTTDPSQKRLLEFGWDTPWLHRMPDHIDAAQNLPFDGIVFDIKTDRFDLGYASIVFTNERINETDIADLVQSFNGFEWGRLTDNFLRINISPGEVDWFDNFDTVLFNVEVMARAAHELGFVGVMLDTEQYGDTNIFNYASRTHNNVYGFVPYTEKVFYRGQQVMQALNAGYPGLTVLYTFGLTIGSQPGASVNLSTFFDGLRIPFIQGMIAGADDQTTLVDAFEASYFYTQDSEFAQAYQWITSSARDLTTQDHNASGRSMRAGFGLWIDHDCGSGGLQVGGCPGGFTPQTFENALDSALRYADRYVWIYSNKINWYSGESVPQNWRDIFDRIRSQT